MSTTITDYQAAIRTLYDARAKISRFMDSLSRAAQLLNEWNPNDITSTATFFSTKPGDWPSRAELEEAVREWGIAMAHAKVAWAALTPFETFGLCPPETHPWHSGSKWTVAVHIPTPTP